MIKSLVILVLLVLLGVGSALSRPTEADFKQFVHDRIAAKSTTAWEKWQIDANTDSYLKSVIISNRVFWTTVTKDGEPEYTGVFSHWFDRKKISSEVQKVEHTTETKGSGGA